MDFSRQGVLQEGVDVVGCVIASYDVGLCSLVRLVDPIVFVDRLFSVMRDGGILIGFKFLDIEFREPPQRPTAT